MRYILLLILFVFFGYAIGLVITNNQELPVNLLFVQSPEMNLGSLLIMAMILGVVIGILLSIQLFKVIQNKWEISQLKKENKSLKNKLNDAQQKIEEKTKLLAATNKIYADTSKKPTETVSTTEVK